MYNFLLDATIWLTSFLQRVQFYLRRKIRYGKRDKVLDRNIVFKDKYKGKRCYILGNAPSLAKHDLSLLANEHVFVVNSFYLHEQIKTIKPEFYVFADPSYWDVNNPEVLEIWKELGSKTHGLGINYLVSVRVKDTPVIKLLDQSGVYFVDISLPFYPGSPYKFDMTMPVNGTQNSLGLCMQYAIYMGFEEIYLLGADHDWLTNYKIVNHFYDASQVKLKMVVDARQIPYHVWATGTSQIFWEYNQIKQYANSRGVQIYNASEAGVLDVFPLTTFKDSLNKAAKS